MFPNCTVDLDVRNTSAYPETEMECLPSPSLAHLVELYKPIHGYLVSFICSLGVLTNIVTTMVLVQPSMRLPTNILLLGVAVADILTMGSYLVYTFHFSLVASEDWQQYSHPSGWIAFLIVHNAIVITAHTAATFFIVALGVFRCLTLYGSVNIKHLCHPRYCCCLRSSLLTESPRTCCKTAGAVTITNKHAYSTVATISVASILFCSPNHAFYRICEIRPGAYWFQTEPESITQLLDRYRFTVYGCFVKMLSSFLIVILTALLIAALKKAKRRRKRLNMASKNTTTHATQQQGQGNNETKFNSPEGEPISVVAKNNATIGTSLLAQNNTQQTRRQRQRAERQRTTTMLIFVAAVFVVIELPQGILNTMVAFDKGDCFMDSVYLPIGNVMDTLVVLSSCVNFILYCSMSQQFRDTFLKLFCHNPLCVMIFGRHRVPRGEIPFHSIATPGRRDTVAVG